MLDTRLRSSTPPSNGRHRSRCLAAFAHAPHHSGAPIALPTMRLVHAINSRPQCGTFGAKAVRSSSHRRLVKTAAAEVADIQTYEDPAGPAFKDTLKMLEWHRLSEHLAKHASTAVGKRMCLNLKVPTDMPSSVRLLNETRAMLAMENDYMSLLDYGGINTSDAEGAIKRAAKGGMVSGKQLRGLVTMLQGADRLKRQIQLVARQNNVTNKDSPIWPLLAAAAAVSSPKGLMRDIAAAVNEDGQLADSASEQVRTTRGKVQGITSRINNILKGYPGEASEKSGRLCVAVPAGTKITNGVMLGSSIGGGMVFIEPAQVVPQNNELAAARAEAMAAEENVLWDLSGRVMGVQDDVEMAFNTVGWLDLLSAKVRFGMWLGAVMPDFTSWDDIFHRRCGSAINRVRQQHHGDDNDPSPINWDNFAAAGAAAAAAVHLRKFSHPLLLADFLEQQQQLERQQRQQSGAAAGSSGSSRKINSRLLGTRKEVINMQYGNGSNGSSGSSSAADTTDKDQLRDLKPPRTIDLVIQPETSVVVITGPNTGGKTATMKAFGLAVCMAKAGLLIPAAAPARVPCYTSVLADVGDEQSLTANLSTFSGHIKRISALRAEADGRSLLLLDELGTGTDPVEGAALGLALLKQLIKGGIGNGALTIATTHHSIMTSLKFEDPRAENASVEFDEQALAPTYKLLWGVPGRSNALNIAARLGLDPSIVAAARQRLSAGVSAANEAIQELEVAQDELKQADLAAFAVEADVNYTKDRLQEVKNLVLTAQQELALKRSAAIQEVGSAARGLLRALKQERQWRQKGKITSKINRQLSMALGNDAAATESGDVAAAKVQSLDDAIKSFNALSTSNSKYDTVWDVQQRQLQQQEGQQLQAAERWVRAWRKLADRARRVLEKSLAPNSAADDIDAAASADIDMEIEFELQEHNARAAAREAKQQQQVAKQQQQVVALQQMVDEVAAQRREQSSQGSTDEQVSRELFATGVSLVEQALDTDEVMQQMQQKLKKQQAMAVAAEQARAEEAARKQAEDAALINSLESELDTWYLEQVAAAEQRQQQEQEAAAAAAAAAAEARRRQQSADLDAIAAFEDMMVDLEPAGSSSSSSSAARGPHKRPAATEHMQSAKPHVQQQQQRMNRTSSSSNTDNSSSSSSKPGIESDLLGGDLELLLDSLNFDSLLPAADLGVQLQQQQQQLQQRQRKQSKQPPGKPTGKQKGKPAMKFRLS